MSETGLKILKIKRNDLPNTPIAVGNIIYCTDTFEMFVDNANFERNYVENLILLSTELDRESISISNINTNKYYLVEETLSIYKFKYSWIRQAESIILGGVMLTELTPTTMTKDDIGLAPRTLTNCVYMDDGSTLTSALDEIILDGKRFVLKTSIQNLTVEYENQKVFKIPVPFDNYDYGKFPMIFLINNVVLSPMLYVVNNTDNQLIISNNTVGTKIGDVASFIFNYVSIINETEGIDAESVNGVRYFVGVAEPYNKIATDVWIDLTNKTIKQYNGTTWEIIVNGQGGGEENGGFAVVKNSVSVTSATSFVEIGVPSYKKNLDLMFVYRNSIYLEENDDYIVDADGIRITPLNGDIWTGTTTEPTVFNFVILKNVPLNQIGVDGSVINDGTVTYAKLAEDVKQKFSDIFNKFNNYTTTIGLIDILKNYVTTTSFTQTLSGYMTNTLFTTTIASYVKNTDLSKALLSYYTATQIDSTLRSYSTKAYVDNLVNTTSTSLKNLITAISLTPGPPGPPGPTGDSSVIVSSYAPSNPRVGLVWVKIP